MSWAVSFLHFSILPWFQLLQYSGKSAPWTQGSICWIRVWVSSRDGAWDRSRDWILARTEQTRQRPIREDNLEKHQQRSVKKIINFQRVTEKKQQNIFRCLIVSVCCCCCCCLLVCLVFLSLCKDSCAHKQITITRRQFSFFSVFLQVGSTPFSNKHGKPSILWTRRTIIPASCITNWTPSLDHQEKKQ